MLTVTPSSEPILSRIACVNDLGSKVDKPMEKFETDWDLGAEYKSWWIVEGDGLLTLGIPVARRRLMREVGTRRGCKWKTWGCGRR